MTETIEGKGRFRSFSTRATGPYKTVHFDLSEINAISIELLETVSIFGDQSKRYSKIFLKGFGGFSCELMIDADDKDDLLMDWKRARESHQDE